MTCWPPGLNDRCHRDLGLVAQCRREFFAKIARRPKRGAVNDLVDPRDGDQALN
jgi:hypothetical protein